MLILALLLFNNTLPFSIFVLYLTNKRVDFKNEVLSYGQETQVKQIQ